MGLKGGESISDEDLLSWCPVVFLKLSALERKRSLKEHGTAAKYAIAHKGILLPRERKHLAKLGFTEPKELTEIIFCAGHIYANNLLMVSLIEQGMPVAKMFRAAGPFAATAEGGEAAGWWVEDE